MTHDEKIVEAVACAIFHAKPRNRIWDALPNEFKNQYRKQARAAITAFQAEAWQDIGTAPKDGREIDLWCRNATSGSAYYSRFADMYFIDGHWEDWHGYKLEPKWEPTHWRQPILGPIESSGRNLADANSKSPIQAREE